MMPRPLLSKPSMHASSWLSVCSASSLPRCRRNERCLPSASSSSMKRMQGDAFLAFSNSVRTRAAPRPTNISTKSEPVQ
eukprot:scaffold114_cov361-Pinguiococcus_pyrenoidosus.AAC.3